MTNAYFPPHALRLLPLVLWPVAGFAQIPASLAPFLGEPYSLTHELWTGDIGGRSILAAWNGDVLVVRGGASSEVKRSSDGGLTWTSETASGAARYSNAVLDEGNGNIIVMNASSNVISTSSDHGASWTETTSFLPAPDGFGLRPTSYSSHQAGITLRYGPHAGRLLVPARVQLGGNETEARGHAYNSAVYSDDGGQSWRTSHPFPVFGTGEAALVELNDGRVLYSSREHMSRGNRYFATSYDGGQTWVAPYRHPVLPDGERGTSYGCMGGIIRLPVDEYDILLYSNLDTDSGELPGELGATYTRTRQKITIWVSFDGGQSWPVKRLVFDGPSAYSNLGVGRAGTASEGRIFLMYDGGPISRNSAAQIVVCNLSWLLDGRDIAEFIN